MEAVRSSDEPSAADSRSDADPQPASQAPIAPSRAVAAPWLRVAREEWRLLAAAATLILGIIFVMLGWWGAAHTNVFTEQIPYLISGGLLGLGLIIVAAVMAYSGMQERAVDGLRRDLLAALERMPSANGSSPAPARPDAARVLVVRGGRSYHTPGCPIAEKDGVRELALREALDARLAPCKLCGPD